jgi:NADH dehydrogenase [ubiquinone] 1 alpha subcomplex assembly factor 6
MSTAGSDEVTAYCAEMLCRQDHERYLTCLFAPASARPALFALYAFNLEVAKTPDVVSEPTIGLVRLQWWRDAVASVYGGRATPHAVVEALGEAVARHRLSQSHFEHLIDAREADLDAEPPADLAALEAYARDTSARLLWLALEVLSSDREPDSTAITSAESIGLAWALTGLLRAVPYHARRRKSFLPADMVRASCLDLESVFALQTSEPLRRLTEQLAARAEAHLVAARRLRRQVPPAARPALWFGHLASGHLRLLRAVNYDPFDARVQRPPAGTAWRLAWARVSGRY